MMISTAYMRLFRDDISTFMSQQLLLLNDTSLLFLRDARRDFLTNLKI